MRAYDCCRELLRQWSEIRRSVKRSVAPRQHPVILCLEDQETPLSIRKLLLEKSGYAVLTATCGEEALRLLQSDHVDLVLSDHYLRGELGTALAARMKVRKPEVPILIISGSSDTLDGIEGVDGFVSKVNGPTDLLVSIARALKL